VQVDFLSRVHHRHLVELLGFCQENGEQMLVYELMAQGPLSSHLYGMPPELYSLGVAGSVSGC
jgi:hypothetical protein